MIDRDVLFTVAEIAVALAGFSAIIGVLSTRKSSSDLKVNSLRLQVMLESCFMVAAMSLIPVVLEQFNISAPVLWRVACAAFLCVVIPYEFVARKRTKGMPNMTLTKLNVNTVNWALSFGADLVLVAILLSLVGAYSEAFYLVVLLLQLTVAGTLFIHFAAETFTLPNQD